MRVDDYDASKRCLVNLDGSTVERPRASRQALLEEIRPRPYPHGMTETLDTAATTLIAAVEEIGDPVERYQAVKELESRLDTDLKRVKAEITKSLKEGRTWDQVGALLGVTGSRAEQISRASR